jgi:hypothetical protein
VLNPGKRCLLCRGQSRWWNEKGLKLKLETLSRVYIDIAMLFRNRSTFTSLVSRLISLRAILGIKCKSYAATLTFRQFESTPLLFH